MYSLVSIILLKYTIIFLFSSFALIPLVMTFEMFYFVKLVKHSVYICRSVHMGAGAYRGKRSESLWS